MNNNAKQRQLVSRVSKANRKTTASNWNAGMLVALQRELEQNPEMGMISFLKPSYSTKLERLKNIPGPARRIKRPLPTDDIRSRLGVHHEATFVHDPTPALRDLLPADQDLDLSEAIIDLIEEADVIYLSIAAASRSVYRLSDTIVCKIANQDAVVHEYHALMYLENELPDFSAPRAHGVVHFGCYGLLFSDYVDGRDLSTAWPKMTPAQKQSISSQLDSLFSRLRELPQPADVPLGTLQNGGCVGNRRGDCGTRKAMTTMDEFDDWMLTGSRYASPVYIRFMKELMATQPLPQVRFTHCDLRMENVLVDRAEEGDDWKIQAVVDWEEAGFYPDYWEAAMMTVNMTTTSQTEWYNHLPASISPHRYAGRWLIDTLWSYCTY